MTHTPEDIDKLVERLSELDRSATPGEWGQYSPTHGPWKEHAKAKRDWLLFDTSHDVSTMRNDEPYKIAQFHHAADAAFAETVVNAYRNGVLVSADALTAQQRRIADLEKHLGATLAVITDYLEYEHDGDPWAEDARLMCEMDINFFERDGGLAAARAALQSGKGE